MKPRRSAKIECVFDKIESLHRKPTAAPTLSVEVAISTALSMFVPGPASLISPTGRGVWLIMRALRQCGYSIVPTEKADHDHG